MSMGKLELKTHKNHHFGGDTNLLSMQKHIVGVFQKITVTLRGGSFLYNFY
jgi:hypothetical protein